MIPRRWFCDGPLANLLNAVGAALKPKVFCVGELADQGAGHPDFGLYAAKQVQRGRPRGGQTPERGVVEVKAANDDAWLTAAGGQVSRYWGRYRLVLVTNTRDFVLVGEDAAGRPARLESFRLAEGAEDFHRKLEKPRAFARDVGPGLGEYLGRALSHRAALAEPKDLAWLLASYARDGLTRVEAADDAPSLKAVRSTLEDALGVRGSRRLQPTHSIGAKRFGIFERRWFRRSLAHPASARALSMAARNGVANAFSLAAPTPLTSANSSSVRGRRRAMSINERSGNTILYQRRKILTRKGFPFWAGCDSKLAK